MYTYMFNKRLENNKHQYLGTKFNELWKSKYNQYNKSYFAKVVIR